MTRNYRLKALVFSSIFPLVLTGCFSNEDIQSNSSEERSINTEDDSSKEFEVQCQIVLVKPKLMINELRKRTRN